MMAGGFTQKELIALKEFRHRVSDILPDEFSRRDDSLIRWIRAREMDLDKAEDMIRNSMEWRKNNKIDQLLSGGLDPELSQKFQYNIDGVDKCGRPVVTMAFGTWDVRSFIETEDPALFAKYTNQLLEQIGQAIKRCTFEIEKQNRNDNNDQPCVQFVGVSDMSGYSFRQLANMKAVQSLIQMVSVFEAHYPETMGQFIVINAPAVFSILFGMLKPFMSGRTVDKIKIYSSDKEQWQPVVLDLIDASQIRERYGGTRKD